VLDTTKERLTADERRWDEDTYLIDAVDRVYIIISESIPRVGGALASVRIKEVSSPNSGKRDQVLGGSRRHDYPGRHEGTQVPYQADKYEA
jgi:hypothetical protein